MTLEPPPDSRRIPWMPRMHALSLGATILLGVALRFHGLGAKSLWIDEITVLQAAQRDFLGILEGAKGLTSHPPLDFIFLAIPAHFCQSEFCLRFPAALWGILTLAAAYRLGKQVLGARPALVGTLLLAVSPLHIHFSQEQKFYSILAFFSVLSLLFFIRGERLGTVRGWIAYALVMVAGVYAHGYIALVGVLEGCWLLGRWLAHRMRLVPCTTPAGAAQLRRNVIAFLLVGVLVVALYTPWIAYDYLQQAHFDFDPGQQESAPLRFHTAVKPALFLRLFLDMVLSTEPSVWLWVPGRPESLLQIPVGAVLAYALLFAAAVGSLLLLYRRRWNLLLLLVALGPLLTLLLNNAGGYWFSQRQVVYILPAYLLLAGYGIVSCGDALGRWVGRRGGRWIASLPLLSIVVALALLSVKPIQANYAEEVQNWRGAALLLRHQARPGDQIFGWKYAWLPLTLYQPSLAEFQISRHNERDVQDLQRQLGEADGRIWYVRDHVWLENRRLLEAWAGSDALVTVDLGAVDVSFWHKGNVPAEQLEAERQALLEEATVIHPTFRGAIDLGDILMKQNQEQLAVAQYETAIQLAPMRGMGYTRLGNALRPLGRLSEAESAYRRALEAEPGYVGAYVNLADMLLAQGRSMDAMVTYGEALDIAPDSGWVHSASGTAYLRLGDTENALAHLRRAVELEPENVTWLLALADALRELGQSELAAETYRQVLLLQPGNRRAGQALQALQP